MLKKLAVGAAIAGAAGYVAGVLTAPSEGRKTRTALKKSAHGSVGEVERQLKQLHTDLGGMVTMAKDNTQDMSARLQKKFSGALNNARTTKDKLAHVLSSVRDGEASDKDLQKALEDARRALEHLKQFIKK